MNENKYEKVATTFGVDLLTISYSSCVSVAYKKWTSRKGNHLRVAHLTYPGDGGYEGFVSCVGSVNGHDVVLTGVHRGKTRGGVRNR